MKIAVPLLLLMLISAVLGDWGGRKRVRIGGKKRGRRGGRKGGRKGKKAKKVSRKGPKSLSGSITVVSPSFEPINDAYENLLGIRLITTGTCDILGDFTATFFFTPFQGQETFDGTCTIEDVAGNILNAAFFDAKIIPPSEGEADLLVPIEAHILGGTGALEDYTGKLDLQGRITPSKENGFGPTTFIMTGTMIKPTKKLKKKHLKFLRVLPQSVEFDGQATIPDVSKALERKTIREMKALPEAEIEPESETEPYAGTAVPVAESSDEEDVAIVSKLEGTGTAKKLGRFNMTLLLKYFEVGMPCDGTMMMKMVDKGHDTEHSIRGQFSKAILKLTEDGDYRLNIPAIIIGGYGDYREAKGVMILDGSVHIGNDGGLTVGNISVEGDIITGAIVDEWAQQDHEETLHDNGR